MYSKEWEFWSLLTWISKSSTLLQLNENPTAEIAPFSVIDHRGSLAGSIGTSGEPPPPKR